MDNKSSKTRWRGFKGVIVVVVGTFGLGAMYYGSGVGIETSKQSPLPPAASQTDKPVRAMNLALGPMVFLARDLDFAVKNAKGDTLNDSRIAARVETQLQGLREIYRREVAKNQKLVGNMILQLSVNPAGQVNQVKEVTSRLNNSEFRQTVAAESGKWSFADLTTEPLTVQIPLLFVLEGMDITTLVRWESSLAGAPEKVAVAPAAKAEAIQPVKAAASPTRLSTVAKPAPAPEKATPASVTTQGEEVQIKYATLLRKEPNFTAPVLTTFTIGTKVIVINRSNDWLEVRSQYDGPSGYIRKEFIVPVDVVAHH